MNAQDLVYIKDCSEELNSIALLLNVGVHGKSEKKVLRRIVSSYTKWYEQIAVGKAERETDAIFCKLYDKHAFEDCRYDDPTVRFLYRGMQDVIEKTEEHLWAIAREEHGNPFIAAEAAQSL